MEIGGPEYREAVLLLAPEKWRTRVEDLYLYDGNLHNMGWTAPLVLVFVSLLRYVPDNHDTNKRLIWSSQSTSIEDRFKAGPGHGFHMLS